MIYRIIHLPIMNRPAFSDPDIGILFTDLMEFGAHWLDELKLIL